MLKGWVGGIEAVTAVARPLRTREQPVGGEVGNWFKSGIRYACSHRIVSVGRESREPLVVAQFLSADGQSLKMLNAPVRQVGDNYSGCWQTRELQRGTQTSRSR